MFHAQMAALGCLWYGEWVPSKANPADIPTRPDRAHEMSPTARYVEMVLPPVESIEADIAEWIRSVKAGGP